MTIKDLVEGSSINNMILYCTGKTSCVSVKGDNYLSLTLQDSSGNISGKIWEVNSNIDNFEVKDFVSVTANVTAFKGALQLNISNLSKVDKNTINMEDFCPKASRPIEDIWSELINFVNSVHNKYLNNLLHAFFDNAKIAARFKNNSAAKTVHHAYIGGLLDHSLSVTKICSTLADNYPMINRDLLITAALLHDIGKIKEINEFPDNDYTDEGNLLGHIYMGAEMVDIQVRKIDGFPKVLANEIKHCILAHHGQLEFGSPKAPALIEALALSFADDTDAKLRRFSDLLVDNDGNWTERSDFFLGTKYRKTIITD